jgi:hypothetical protein
MSSLYVSLAYNALKLERGEIKIAKFMEYLRVSLGQDVFKEAEEICAESKRKEENLKKAKTE